MAHVTLMSDTGGVCEMWYMRGMWCVYGMLCVWYLALGSGTCVVCMRGSHLLANSRFCTSCPTPPRSSLLKMSPGSWAHFPSDLSSIFLSSF